MKLLKRIYYPTIVFALVLALVLTIVISATGGGGNRVDTDRAFAHAEGLTAIGRRGQADTLERSAAIDLIVEALTEGGFGLNEDTDGFVYTGTSPQPTVIVSQDTLTGHFDGAVAAGVVSYNIIAVIPGTATYNAADYASYGRAIAFFANYDTSMVSGGAGNSAAVGALIETAIALRAGDRATHDLVFVFGTNGEWGQLAFLHAFEGFGGISGRQADGDVSAIPSRLSFVVDFDARSNRGSLSLNTASYNAAAAFTAASSGVNAASVNITEPSTVFYGIPHLNFAALGASHRADTQLDTAPSRRITNQTAGTAYNLARNLGSHSNLDRFVSDTASSASFTYLGLQVVYGRVVGIVLAVIILLLAAAVITLNILKLGKSGEKGMVASAVANITKAAVAQIVGMAIVAATLYIIFFALAVVAMGFGVIVPQSIGVIVFGNAALVIGAMIFAVAMLIWVFVLGKRILLISSADMARGALAIWIIAAVVTAFFFTPMSYLFILMALLQLVVSLVKTLAKDAFRAKTGMPLDALVLQIVPLIILLPLLFPILALAAGHLPMIMLPLVFALFAAYAGFAVPYFNLTKPFFARTIGKILPNYTIRYERTVTERVEDKAKRGKFKEAKVKKVFPEKRKLQYGNRYAVGALAIVSVIVLISSSFFGTTFGASSVAMSEDLYMPAYKDAIVLHWDSTTDFSWRIGDINAYSRFRWAIFDSGFRWDDELSVFSRALSSYERTRIGDITPPSVRKISNVEGEVYHGRYEITPFRPTGSRIRLTLTDASAVRLISIFTTGSGGEPMEIRIPSAQETIDIELPFGMDIFEIMVDEPTNVDLHISEYIFDAGEIMVLSDFLLVSDHLGDNNVPPRASLAFSRVQRMSL